MIQFLTRRLLLLGAAAVVVAAPAHGKDAPNVMFILTEDQGAHMSRLGTPGLQTPHMDGLARSGVYFSNAFVAYPVCSASKAALYTGLHSHTNGILNNTYNFHKPASQVTAAERQRPLSRTNKIKPPYVTLTELLHDAGYYQGVTHKLHVLPNEKFPYDEFLGQQHSAADEFLSRATAKDQPWFLMVNIANSHRPYPNSDKEPIRVDPNDVSLPSYLPDTPEVRKDWAEYLAAIEETDALVGTALKALENSGQADNTIVVLMSDHGPTFQHGKMTLYDLGLRVPLAIRVPAAIGQSSESESDRMVSAVDLLPTLLDLLSIDASQRMPYRIDGISFADQWGLETDSNRRELVFAEISNRGPLPNDGMQERCVMDARHKLIVRQKTETLWRQVNADSRNGGPWGNRVYAETLRVKDAYPHAYRVLQEMDPQNLGGPVPKVELYDLQSDPDEMSNLADQVEMKSVRERLQQHLRQWTVETDDPAFQWVD